MKSNDTEIVEIYLEKWGYCMRKGWGVDLGYPHTQPFVQVPGGMGEYNEPEYLQFVNRAVFELPETQGKVINLAYWQRKKLHQIAEELKIKYGRAREHLQMGRSGVYMHLKANNVIK